MTASRSEAAAAPGDTYTYAGQPLLEGRVAIVTGSARGMGEQTARLFARQGAKVCLWDVLPGVREVAESISEEDGNARAFEVDTTLPAHVNQAVRAILNDYNRVDILVNCAGIARQAMFLEMEDSLRDDVLGVNLIGTWNCCRAVLPAMVDQRGGRIINISSVTGPMTVLAGASAYGASKAAVSALTKALAVEMGPYGITVNAILPGAVATPMLTGFFAEQGWDPEEVLSEMAKNVPLGRVAKPEDIAGACLMLVSDYASYITGVELVVDGALNLPERG